MKHTDPVTQLLQELEGDKDKRQLLLSMIYDDLHRVAENLLTKERQNHTLCATDLIGESYLKLFNDPRFSVLNRGHFFAIAARAMRQILVDHARSKKRLKRDGIKITLSSLNNIAKSENDVLDILEIENALCELQELDSRQAYIVELKFYAGMTIEEIAAIVEISEATVKREWTTAKIFLKSKIQR